MVNDFSLKNTPLLFSPSQLHGSQKANSLNFKKDAQLGQLFSTGSRT